MTLPDRIRTARIAAGLYQYELAMRVFVSRGTLLQYERGTRRPSPEVARRLGAVLGIDLGIREACCQVGGCSRPHHARNLCVLHYQRAKLRGFIQTGAQA